MRSTFSCPRLGLGWPEFPVPASPVSSGHWHPWRRHHVCLPRRPAAPNSREPLDLRWMAEIAYPFGVKWPVHRGPMDPAHCACVSACPRRVVHHANRIVPRVRPVSSRGQPAVKPRPFCIKALLFLVNQPAVRSSSNKLQFSPVFIRLGPCVFQK